MRLLTGLRLLPVLLLLTACRHRPPGDPAPLDRPPVRVEATNLYPVPVEVFAAGNGTVVRLGLVEPGLHSGFTIPLAVIGQGSVELRAHPTINGPLFRSGPLLLSPGAIVDLVINASFFNSTAVIRPD
jgi:hypothetical protein